MKRRSKAGEGHTLTGGETPGIRALSMLRIYIAVAVMDFCSIGGQTAMVLLAEAHFKASAVEVGLLVALGSMVYVITSTLFGAICERISRHTILAGAFVTASASFGGMYLSTALWQIYLLNVLATMSTGAFWPAMETRLSEDTDRETLRRRLRNFNLLWCSSAAFGGLVAGSLFDLGARIPFALVALMTLASTSLVYERSGMRKTIEPPATGQSPPSRRYLAMVWIGSFAFMASVGILRALFPKLALRLGYTGTDVGVVLFGLGFTRFFTFLFLGMSRFWIRDHRYILLIELLGPLAGMLIALGSSRLGFILGASLLGIANGAAYQAGLYHSVRGGRIGRQAGMHEAIVGAGFFAGPALGGVVAQLSQSVRSAFILLGLITLVSVVLQFMFLRSARTGMA